jgi:branched-chain amino acid transport system substrate-binding protein
MARKFFSIGFMVGLMVCLLSGITWAKKSILVGCPLPLTGPYASDGEQMKMALEMAAAEYNANGGLLGQEIKLEFGDVGGLEAEKIKAVGERLIAAGVNAVITGYDDSGVDTKVFGQYDIPYLHGNAMTLCTAPVAKHPEKYWNCFQYTYNDMAYGSDAANTLFTVPEKMRWTPPNKKIAIIKVDYAYNIMPADEFAKRAEKLGYEVVLNETVPFGVAEWGPILLKIRSKQPAYVTFWDLDPTDAARFMKQFVDQFGSEGINSLVWMQFTPSIPEFLKLAGKSANGLIWVAGANSAGKMYQDYRKRWIARYKKAPAGLYAVVTRDGFDIWAGAVKRAGCVTCYREVCRQIRETPYNGMGATYVFNPIDQSAIPGEYLMPMVWYQIRDGKNIPMSPKSFKEGDYQKPPWIKK